MTTLTDLQLVTIRWNEASTATGAGHDISDLDTVPVALNIKTISGYVVGERDGAKIIAQIALLDAVYIPVGSVIDIEPVKTITVAPATAPEVVVPTDATPAPVADVTPVVAPVDAPATFPATPEAVAPVVDVTPAPVQ
jgi:hypothetical protein